MNPPNLHWHRSPLAAALLSATLLSPHAALASDAHATKPADAARAAKPANAAPDDDAAAKVASVPALAPVDPIDVLRRRLAERFAGGKPADVAAGGDVRVVARTGAAPTPAHPRARAAAHKTVEAHAAAGQAAHWAYNGTVGPAAWGVLRPEFSMCASGQRQSPIDIRGGLAVDLDPVRFDYQPSRFGVLDNGHTVQVNIAPGNAIEVGGKRFELLQLHFHRPSEERIDGRQFEMSVHLVHKDDQGRLAVVAVLLDKGQAQPVVQKVWNNLPLEKNEEAAAKALLELQGLLPADRRYFTYMGSLTTPPCSEGVQWIVMRQPVTVTAEQIEIFARMYPMNARPVQQLAGRRILQSN